MAQVFDLSPEPVDFLLSALQELCNQIGRGVMELEDERRDVMIEKESLLQFSKYVNEIKNLLQVLQAKRLESLKESASTRNALQSLDLQLRQAYEIIKKYKSGSRLWLLLKFSSLLKQMEQSAKEISETVSILSIANYDTTHNIASKTEQLVSNLHSLEFRSAAATEAIVSEIEKSMAQNGRNREHTNKLLQKIAEAVGVTASASLVHEELELLKREKEEMEAKKQQDEALQLSQLIGLLSSSEMVSRSKAEGSANAPSSSQHGSWETRAVTVNPNPHQEPISSFMCTLSGKVLEDPVAINCGHSFERSAIQEHFGRGKRTCPTCYEKLPSLELTPNFSLRSTIQEWKQQNMDIKLQRAVSSVTSDDPNKVRQALEDLKVLMEMPRYKAAVTEQGLVPKIAALMKAGNRENTKAALKCLCHLANHSEDNKKAIVEAGAIHCIEKQFRRGEAEPDAVAVLVELSENEAFAEEIGNTKDCIPFLVSLLQNRNLEVSEKAEKVVQNLSFNTHFVIKMAEAGYFHPFIARFIQGALETQASMATELVRMQLNEEKVKAFEHKQFVGSLVRLLSSSSPAFRLACLHCIKKLSAYPTMAKWFLGEAATIPNLISLISYASSDPDWRQVATQILTSMVESSQLSDFESNPNLQELQSHHNIGVFLNFVTTVAFSSQTKAQFLCLLLAIGSKSPAARDMIRSNDDAITHLFSSLNDDTPEVTRETLKLLYCIAIDEPAGIPLPPLPAKESAINALVTILISSPDTQDRTIAAGIISRLPAEDATIDHILCRSEALKAIHEVICAADSGAFPAWSLLENVLAALLRYTEPSKPELRKQLGDLELYPSLVRLLSNGSSRTKQRTATALAYLSQPTVLSASDIDRDAGASTQLQWLTRIIPNMSWCWNTPSSLHWNSCSVHGSACSSRQTFCLVKANAVRPLIQTLSDTEAAEAALQALEMLLEDQTTLSRATATIVDSQGVAAILQVLERGSLPAKEKALDLFQKICQHTDLTKQQCGRSERILIQLLQDDALKKKAAFLLSQMEIISKQSSFF